MSSDQPFVNRLIHEKSPYLLQHAHNPVDWYPWGKEAWDLARQEDKPIFLSIGYATCHWCHVMEKESFAEVEIAQMLNEVFVNIKVDREELPCVDSMYMEFAQALTASSGGWPLNLVLTPDLKPFFAATYLPPVTKRGMIGMRQFIEQIGQLWKSDERAQLVDQADKLLEVFQNLSSQTGDQIPPVEMISQAEEVIFELIDPIYGGMKGEPKFPMGYQSLFLLQQAKDKADSRAMFCVELTLDQMARGGIYDHLGGGFSRYAVDERWIIPHFEKMLYDNALLASTYLQAWQFSKKERYRQVGKETLDYILKALRHPSGPFCSAEDADTEGKEGLYYTWTQSEINSLLTPEEARQFSLCYGVTLKGNFEGRNVLHLVEEGAESARKKLLQHREMRSRPFKDDQVICGWNGLAIDALTWGYRILLDRTYADAALETAEFLYTHCYEGAYLKRRWRDQEARFEGSLDDYAYLIKGLLNLFQAGLGTKWLKWAIDLAELLLAEFKAEEGAFYNHLPDPTLLIRRCEFYDGAEPSGNAVHAENLLRLFALTGSSHYLSQAEDILKALKIYLESYPPGLCYHLQVLQRYYDVEAPLFVIALDEAGSLRQEIFERLATHFDPHLNVIWKSPNDPLLEHLVPSLVDKKNIDGQTAVYRCRQDLCEAPLLLKEEIFAAIDRRK